MARSVQNLGKRFISNLVQLYLRRLLRKEYESQSFGWINERPVEYRFALEHLAGLAPTTVLDVGTGTTALPHLLRNCGFLVTAMDNIRDYWEAGMFNRHYYVLDDDIRRPKLNKKFDFLTCVSVLEHIPEHNAAMGAMFSLLNSGGHIVLTFPYNETAYVDNVYLLPEASYGKDLMYVCQVYSRVQVDGWLAHNGARIIAQEYWCMFTGDYWACGERLRPPVEVALHNRHHLTCLLLQKA